MLNTKTMQFEERLCALIQDSGLPPCVAGLVLDKYRGQLALLELRARMQEEKAGQEAKEKAARAAAQQKPGEETP